MPGSRPLPKDGGGSCPSPALGEPMSPGRRVSASVGRGSVWKPLKCVHTRTARLARPGPGRLTLDHGSPRGQGPLAWHGAAACWMDGRKSRWTGSLPGDCAHTGRRPRLFRRPCAAGQRLMTSMLSAGPQCKATSNPAPPLMASPGMKTASRSAPSPQSPAGQKLPDYRHHSLSPALKPLNNPLLRLDSLGRWEN